MHIILSIGNFHRSHLAGYMNDLFNTSFDANKNWGIVGTEVFQQAKPRRELLKSQDYLQTLLELDGAKNTTHASILAPMIDFTPITPEHTDFYSMLMDPSIKIVSLTVTEGGYFLNNESKLDLENKMIKHDIEFPDQPTTVFGLFIKSLRERKEKGIPPFTIMSCDNIPHNGHVTRDVVLELATKMYGPELAEWISTNAKFPNSMVDRITPALTPQSTPEIIKLIEDKFGYTDEAPILCEPFRQWVLEDTFVNGERPQWELLDSVSIVDDVAPYENMKIRILNGGHASLCYPAALLGLKYVHNAIGHTTISPFMDVLERKEIIPTLGPVPDTNLEDYWGIIASRFANPTLQDTITRICFDGANRQPKFIVPVVADALAKAAASGDDAGSYDGVVDGLALVSAMWCRYCQGVTEAGETIDPNDPDWDNLHKIAVEAKTNPTVWLDSLPHVYGSVGKNPVFREAFEKAMVSINEKGVEGAMQAYIDANEDSLGDSSATA